MKLKSVFFLLCSIYLYAEPLKLCNQTIKLTNDSYYTFASNKVQIIAVSASWCPACLKTLELLDETSKKYDTDFVIFNIDGANSNVNNYKKTYNIDINNAKIFGLGQRVPFVLVLDKTGTVVKRFEAIPNKTILQDLVKRLAQDRLENGTPNVGNRVELWKKSRYDQ